MIQEIVISCIIKTPSGQERTAAEMKDTVKGSPPQAKNPAKQDSI